MQRLGDSYLVIGVICGFFLFFFLMIRRPPRSTLDRSSAASDVYKRQVQPGPGRLMHRQPVTVGLQSPLKQEFRFIFFVRDKADHVLTAVSYTHLRAHETVLDLVCRLLLEKKKNNMRDTDDT